jgi:uncharacterized protein (DUF1499 family)
MGRILFIVVAILAVLVLAYIGRLVYLVQTMPAPEGFGQGNSSLVCPIDRPSCVSSLNQEDGFKVAALTFSGDAAAAMTKLKKLVANEPRTEVVFASDQRLEVVFKSALFKFRDDVALQINAANNTIDVRSKSRVGYSDLGVNRERVERLRAAFSAAI